MAGLKLSRAAFLKSLGAMVAVRGSWAWGSVRRATRTLPPVFRKLDGAWIRSSGNVLTVSTGAMERHWELTHSGLLTTAVKDVARRRMWAGRSAEVDCDWRYEGWLDGSAEARVTSVEAEISDDQGFTSQHLAVAVEMEYAALGVSLRYIVWAYPGAPGLRTQLWVKGRRPGAGVAGSGAMRCVDFVPVNGAKLRERRYAGFYNDTQHRNSAEEELLREEVRPGAVGQTESVEWANLVSLEEPGAGLVCVKESHKCVNQSGVDTGAFVLDAAGLRNTGWGLGAELLEESKFQWCWASWVVAHDATEDGREVALKSFDRLRFPASQERGLGITANTWGDSISSRDGMNYGSEAQVIAEMRSAHTLGVETLVIDSGWQVGRTAKSWKDAAKLDWRPNPEVYPEGWKPVVEAARQLPIQVGLWAAAQPIPLGAMEWNWDQLHLVLLKLDHANLKDYGEADAVTEKVREFVLHTGHRCAVAWDTTENAPRFGYYWAREYGVVHFMNRKAEWPPNAIYIPWLALRDFWQLARYNNLNKWQLLCCNPERVPLKLSDAKRYSAAYCAATTLMGVPEIFAITRFYSEQARGELQKLFGIYREARAEIFDGLVFAIGDKPSNSGWPGFQSYSAETQSGCLLVFRERLNAEPVRSIRLRFVREGMVLSITDLRRKETAKQRVGSAGEVRLEIADAGDFLFLRYRVG